MLRVALWIPHLDPIEVATAAETKKALTDQGLT